MIQITTRRYTHFLFIQLEDIRYIKTHGDFFSVGFIDDSYEEFPIGAGAHKVVGKVYQALLGNTPQHIKVDKLGRVRMETM